MALTNAEKQKRWRERQKAIKAGLIEPERKPDPVDLSFLLDGFSAWIRESEERIELVEFIEQDISHLTLNHLIEKTIPGELIFSQNTISMCFAAMRDIAGLLSKFKSAKISEEIRRIENEELDVPELRSKALDKIVQLRNFADRLNRKIRWETDSYFMDEEFSSQQNYAQQNGIIIEHMAFDR